MNIPIGKAMAEALLEDSDESTASLSDVESFEGEATLTLRYPNPKAKSFTPQPDFGIRGKHRHRSPTHGSPPQMLVVRPPPGFLQHHKRSPWHVSKNPHMSALLANSGFSMTGSGSGSHHVALDCEMVGVGPGGARSVLARVAIIDYFGNRLLDEFVRVEERISDYRYHITGISPSDLESPKAISYGKCRQEVIRLLRGKVLVGHALQNDLQVLGIHHPWHNIRDTAAYPQFMKYDRYGQVVSSRLRDLAKIHLGIDIQDECRPHCPLEDACAAMALYRKSQGYWDCFMASNTPAHLQYPTMVSNPSRIYS